MDGMQAVDSWEKQRKEHEVGALLMVSSLSLHLFSFCEVTNVMSYFFASVQQHINCR